MMNINILLKRIERMEELYPDIISGLKMQLFNEDDYDQEKQEKLVREYKKHKTNILYDLYNESVFTIENKYLTQLREKLQRLSIYGDPNLPKDLKDKIDEKFFHEITQYLGPELSYAREEKLLDDFHSWYSGYDYIRNKMSATFLVVKAGVIPESLKRYTHEIRECLAFDRLLGAAALLRVTLEITIEDLCRKNGLDDLSNTTLWNQKSEFWDQMIREEKIDDHKDIDLKRITLRNQINLLSLMDRFSSMKEQSHNIRKDCNDVIHNNVKLDRISALDLTHRTFELIHNLYEAD